MNGPSTDARQGIHLPAVVVASAYLALLLITARPVGFSRDEGFYFKAARSYQGWFSVLFDEPGRAFRRESVDKHWRYNHEHPALMKVLFGFSHRLFHQSLGLLSPSTAYRLPGMVAAAMVIYLLFVWGAQLYGRPIGLFAALAFGFLPRVFYHAHLACFDVAITAAWLLVCYLYWRSLSSWRFGLAAGAAFGVAICVKLNAFFLPFLLGLHYLVLLAHRRRRLGRLAFKDGPKPWAFLFGLLVAPPIFLLHWPWLWFDTFTRLGRYVGFHAAHAHYNTAWFGENIIGPPTPLSLPVVMTLLTVPSVIVLLFVAGALVRLRHYVGRRLDQRLWSFWPTFGPPSQNGLDLLVWFSVIFPIALISMPHVPIFGGTKHWMPAYPFVALVAGIGVSHLIATVANGLPRLPRRVVQTLVVIALLVPAVQQSLTAHPHGLASYVPLAGGAPGAASLGMTRQFWGYTTAGIAPWLNENAPQGSTVFFHDTSAPSVEMFRRESIVRPDLQSARLRRADYALVHHELHMIMVEAWIWSDFRTHIPAHVLTYQGVPLVSVYRRPSETR